MVYASIFDQKKFFKLKVKKKGAWEGRILLVQNGKCCKKEKKNLAR